VASQPRIQDPAGPRGTCPQVVKQDNEVRPKQPEDEENEPNADHEERPPKAVVEEHVLQEVKRDGGEERSRQLLIHSVDLSEGMYPYLQRQAGTKTQIFQPKWVVRADEPPSSPKEISLAKLV